MHLEGPCLEFTLFNFGQVSAISKSLGRSLSIQPIANGRRKNRIKLVCVPNGSFTCFNKLYCCSHHLLCPLSLVRSLLYKPFQRLCFLVWRCFLVVSMAITSTKFLCPNSLRVLRVLCHVDAVALSIIKRSSKNQQKLSY
jgi:hypothetical protein